VAVAKAFNAQDYYWGFVEWIEILGRPARATGGAPVRNPLEQEWLPGFDFVPLEAAADTQDALDHRIESIEALVADYDAATHFYMRQLRELKKMKKTLLPYFMGDRKMTVGRAAELYRERQKSPDGQRRQKANQVRWHDTVKIDPNEESIT
jgi:hypothetical protein